MSRVSIDNEVLFDRYEKERAARVSKMPHCNCCGEEIQQDRTVNIDGDYYCDMCLETTLRENIDEF